MRHSLPHGMPKSIGEQALLPSYDVTALARKDLSHSQTLYTSHPIRLWYQNCTLLNAEDIATTGGEFVVKAARILLTQW